MRLSKKQWLLMQFAALLVITGGVLLIRPHLARAVGVTTSSMSGEGVIGIPYQITNCQELQDINLDIDAHYRLMNDIDCSDTINWNSGAGFIPIASNGVSFTGQLDGHNHTISGLYIDRSGAADDHYGATGLFASTGQYSYLLNFKVVGATIIGNSASDSSSLATGGIIGQADGTVIDQLHFDGSISITQCSKTQTLGGIIGMAINSIVDSSNVDRSSSSGTISVTGLTCAGHQTAAGGIFGKSTGYRLNNSFSTMDITIAGSATQHCTFPCRAVGGLIGAGDTNADIDSSYYAGSLTVNDNSGQYIAYQVGGLIGYQPGNYGDPSLDSNILSSFAAPIISVPPACADVDCGTNDRNIGAIVGDNDGTSAAGSGTWTGVYFDQDVAGTTHCADNNDTSNTRCTAVNTDGSEPNYFKGAAPGAPAAWWDFNAIWQTTGNYPDLIDWAGPQIDPPSNITAVIDSSSSITLSWTPPASLNPAYGYQVLCRPVGNTIWGGCSGYTNTASKTITALTPATQYEFKVVSDAGRLYWSDASVSVFATTATPGFELVSNCQDLQNIQNNLEKNYELSRDIDCSDTINWNGGMGFDPIGNFAPYASDFQGFSGILKGNNYTIKNLFIDQSTVPGGNYGNGLFALTYNAIVQDINIDHPTQIGGIIMAGISSFGSANITNTHITNAVFGGAPGIMGGLIGYGNDDLGYGHTLTRSSFTGTMNYTGTTPMSYIGGLMAYADGGPSNGWTITDNYVNVDIMTTAGSSATGGLIGVAVAPNAGTISISRNYVVGSMSITGPYQASSNPQIPDFGSWVAGGFIGATYTANANGLTIANSFAHMGMTIDGSQSLVGNGIGMQIAGPTIDLSSYYVDVDQAGTNQCIGSPADTNCNMISGQPNYFKNNSTNPPLNTWDFANVWMTTSEFPVFGTAVTTGITTIPPERLNPPTTGGGSTGDDSPAVTATAGDNATTTASNIIFGKTVSGPTDEAGVLGAIKHFVRSLPAVVVIGFPYALFGLLFLAALILLVELIRELRRLHILQALIRKQQLLAEERDAFWHLAANYLRAPVTLIVGGAEALHDAAPTPITVHLQEIAASLQAKIAAIMKKIEDSSSLQGISHVQPRKATQIARRAVFIVPVVSVAAMTLLANYAATSYRNMSPGFVGYATQLLGFVIATILFYWVLSLLTQGKSKRQAAEAQLERQTNELANARHELINDTAKQLNPDLTVLEGTIKQLTPEQAALEPTQTLHEGTNRLRDIVTSFTMLIKVQEGTGAVTATPEATTTDLAGILAKTRAKLTPQITAKGVRVVAPSVPLAVHAEADLANQVLESIIANAVDYSPANGTVKIEAKRLQDAIQVRISDQGQGIDKKQLDHLFQPFVRTDGKSAMDMSHGGFGINLYLDKLIMEQMGGSITATSTPGQGTAFTMTWPV